MLSLVATTSRRGWGDCIYFKRDCLIGFGWLRQCFLVQATSFELWRSISRSNGFANISNTVYPGVSDEIWPTTFIGDAVVVHGRTSQCRNKGNHGDSLALRPGVTLKCKYRTWRTLSMQGISGIPSHVCVSSASRCNIPFMFHGPSGNPKLMSGYGAGQGPNDTRLLYGICGRVVCRLCDHCAR